jgi:hypothetical protein
MQFGGSGATSDRQGQWFLHRATHRLLRSSSCHHPTSVLSGSRSEWLWLFPTLKMGLKGTGFTTKGDVKSNPTAELRNIPKGASAGASNSGRIYGAVCARALL